MAAAIKSALGAGTISPERAQLLLGTVKSRVEVDIAALTADRVAKIQGILAAPRLNLMVTYVNRPLYRGLQHPAGVFDQRAVCVWIAEVPPE